MIYLGIGSNLGNRIKNITKAKYFLDLNGINITKSSSYYETLSWPDPNKPKFINIVVQSNTKASPEKLLKIFKSIEKKLGRKKKSKSKILIITGLRPLCTVFIFSKNCIFYFFRSDDIFHMKCALTTEDVNNIKIFPITQQRPALSISLQD